MTNNEVLEEQKELLYLIEILKKETKGLSNEDLKSVLDTTKDELRGKYYSIFHME